MEKIIAIKDYEAKERDGYSNVAGFEVVTNKQIIKLYIENDARCCERWGYFWCNDDPQDFIGAKLRSVRLTDAALNEAQMKANDLDPGDEWFTGVVMFVDLVTDKGILQFVAYNKHNGYYGHDAKVQCTQLTHSETL